MALSHELLSQFAKLVTKDKKTNAETTVYGTIVVDGNGNKYVKLDGSDQLTPLSNEERPVADSTTAIANEGERVSVLIKNHTATVTGNVSSPAARTGDVENLGTHVSEFDILISHQVTADDINAVRAHINELLAITGRFDELSAITAEFEKLKSEIGEFDKITADEIKTLIARVDDLKAETISVDILDAELLEAFSAEIEELKAYTAEFTYISAVRADIDTLNATKLDANFANIDFSNINKAVINELYAKSGLIENVTMEDGTVTGYLVGVTIKGDLIEAGTLVADKLVIKGEDGLYYKLNTNGVTTEAEQTEYNSLNGSIITAKSITASKISVSDLVAFGATIGGFHITDKSLYSGVKESVDNATQGIYMDSEGQISLGDGTNFLRYYRVPAYYGVTVTNVDGLEEYHTDLNTIYESNTVYADTLIDCEITTAEGDPVYIVTLSNNTVAELCIRERYKLEIAAESIWFGVDGKSSIDDIRALTEHIRLGKWIDPETGDEKPSIELAEGDTDFKQVITNAKTMFMNGDKVGTEIDTDGVRTDNMRVDTEIRHTNPTKTGSYVWAFRANGNYGLSWKGGGS